MRELAKYERSERTAQGDSRVQLKLLEGLATSQAHPQLDRRAAANHETTVLQHRHQTLVSLNPLKAYRHAFQWLHCVISVRS